MDQGTNWTRLSCHSLFWRTTLGCPAVRHWSLRSGQADWEAVFRRGVAPITVIAGAKLREGITTIAERESAPGSRVFNALSPHWRGPEDHKDGQEAVHGKNRIPYWIVIDDAIAYLPDARPHWRPSALRAEIDWPCTPWDFRAAY